MKLRQCHYVTAHIGEQLVRVVLIVEPDDLTNTRTLIEVNNFEDGWRQLNPSQFNTLSIATTADVEELHDADG